ncbi:aspartate/glutamate racemase family protein [Chitinasiproducens palmae]|uniref:Aspartate racemase n=1 Tax=Chitinasiproducens palmae TaxID=1770053 RepID=A0A1H2PTY5_9BURK|nr:amino acid racemase [Chitinasiproducens palmae]SDV50246.1 aspartate racemase [Chitinasiproducens palmae]
MEYRQDEADRCRRVAQPRTETVAIIGGMGPEAGIDLTERFLSASRRKMRQMNVVVSDQNYPSHVLVQYRTPDRTAAFKGEGESPLPALVSALATAKAAGASICGVACNTAHLWHDDLARLFPDLRLLHIARETARAVKAVGARNACVLATSATHESGLYRTALHFEGVDVVARPAEEMACVHDTIFAIKAGHVDEARAHIREVVQRCLQEADCVVLGCTELGLVVNGDDYHRGAVVDAAEVLATCLAEQAFSIRNRDDNHEQD